MLSIAVEFNSATFSQLEKERRESRSMAGLLLVLVVLLHIALASYLLNNAKSKLEKKPIVMEVSMVTLPKPPVPVVDEPPPAPAPPPPPVKKEIVKPKPIKKPVVIKKPLPKPPVQTKEIIPIPKFEPTPIPTPPAPVTAPAPVSTPRVVSSTAKAPAKPSQATGHGHSENKGGPSSGVVPVVRVPPRYPASAASRHIEGWVKVEFTIDTSGSVENARVVAAEPEDIFDDAALAAIEKWKFREKIVNGVPTTQRAVQTLRFKLQN